MCIRDSLAGIAEADETYFLELQKGRRQGLSRPPRKRGGKASKRGLSEEQTAAVSYTHLDVYKRQSPVRSPNSAAWPAALNWAQ